MAVRVPRRGEKLELVRTANLNAREETERFTTREEKTTKTMEWLKKALKMDLVPERIEAYDISNTGSSEIVASMTVFVNGRPLKKDYRKFRIKTLTHQDDYHSMAEVLTRRLARYRENDEKFSVLPDLLFIDGGAGQAGAAKEALAAAGLNLPVFGMVKDDRHRTRALVAPDGSEISLSGQPSAFAFVGTIQEETHRFAVQYHRMLRSKNSYGSKLDAIEGVGKKRRNDLLKKFGSIKSIGGAEVSELAEVVPRNTAENIYRYFSVKVVNKTICESSDGTAKGENSVNRQAKNPAHDRSGQGVFFQYHSIRF